MLFLRTHRYNEGTEDYYHAKLLLFCPWRTEEELQDGYQSYEEHYNAVKHVVEENARQFNMHDQTFEEVFDEFQRNGPPETAWSPLDDQNSECAKKIMRMKWFSGEENSSHHSNSPLTLKYTAEAMKSNNVKPAVLSKYEKIK